MAWQQLEKRMATPENQVLLRFQTASTESINWTLSGIRTTQPPGFQKGSTISVGSISLPVMPNLDIRVR